MLEQTAGPIGVHHEWGALREAIVGIGDGVTIPTWTEEYVFLTPQAQTLIKAHQGKRVQDVDPALYERIVEQVASLVATLERRGIVVHRPRPVNADELRYLAHIRPGISQVFTRDPVLVIGNYVIETGMRDPVRRRERFGIRPVLDQHLSGREAIYVSMPEPYPVVATAGFGPGPFLEGGDVLLNGLEIFVGVSGHGSNEAGIRWLQALLGPRYTVHAVRLHPQILHLDCALSLVRPGLAVLCPEAFLDGIPLAMRPWDLIEVGLEAASRLATNGLVVDEHTYITSPEHTMVAEELADSVQDCVGGKGRRGGRAQSGE
jgi:N-dimethylarginine dimethylaminohydrolase